VSSSVAVPVPSPGPVAWNTVPLLDDTVDPAAVHCPDVVVPCDKILYRLPVTNDPAVTVVAVGVVPVAEAKFSQFTLSNGR